MVAAGRGPAQTAVPVVPREKKHAAWHPPGLDLLAAIAVVAALYLPALGFGLVFDDHSLIGENGPVWLGTSLLPYRPLRYLSLLVDARVAAALGGLGAVVSAAAVYHASNLALHLLAFLLLFRLARAWGAQRAPALLAAGLFALHPLAVESVAYVAGRRDLLALICTLGSLLAWTGERRQTALALLLATAAALAKESGLLAFALLPLACGDRGHLQARGVKLAWLAAVLGSASLAVAYGARGPLLPAGSIGGTLLMAPALAAHYARNILWPAALSVDYPALTDAASWQGASPAMRGAGAATLVAAVAACLGQLLRRRRSAAATDVRSPNLLVLWPALTLLSISLLIGAHEPGADRHGYPLLAALAAMLAVAVSRLAPPRRLTALAAMGGAALTLALVTADRLPVWQSDAVLWRATVQTAPDSPRARYNWASALAEAGRPGRARRQLRAALRADPSYGPAQLGLAVLDCAAGRLDAAGEALARAGRLGVPPGDLGQAARGCDERERPRMAAAAARAGERL